jgi:hypothetical protein
MILRRSIMPELDKFEKDQEEKYWQETNPIRKANIFLSIMEHRGIVRKNAKGEFEMVPSNTSPGTK